MLYFHSYGKFHAGFLPTVLSEIQDLTKVFAVCAGMFVVEAPDPEEVGGGKNQLWGRELVEERPSL